MEKGTENRMKDAVLLAGILLAALAIYLLSGNRTAAQKAAAETPLPTVTAAPTASPSPTPPGVAPDDFLAALAGSGDALSPVPGQADTYFLKLASADDAAVTLTCTVQSGRLTGWTLCFPAAAAPKSENADSAIEKALAERAEKESAARRDAVREVLLLASGSALGAAHHAPYDVVMRWYAGAIGVLDGGKSFENDDGPGVFRAFLTESGGEATLYCTLALAR